MPKKMYPRHTDEQLRAKARDIWSHMNQASILQVLIFGSPEKKREIYTADIDSFVDSDLQNEKITAVEIKQIKRYVKHFVEDCGYTTTNSPITPASQERRVKFDLISFSENNFEDEEISISEKSEMNLIIEEQRKLNAKYPRLDDKTAKQLLTKHHEAVENKKSKLANMYCEQISGSYFYLISYALVNTGLLKEKIIKDKQEVVHKAFLYLCNSICKYDADKARNCKVSSYLYACLMNFARMEIVESFCTHIKYPKYLCAEAYKVNKFTQEYLVINGCKPSDELIQRKFGYKDKIWSKIQQVLHQRFLSLDETNEDDTSLGDITPDVYDLEDDYEQNELIRTIHDILRANDVTLRTRMMIVYKYSFFDGKTHSNEETGIWIAQYNNGKKLSAESVRKCIQPAFAILAEHPEIKKIR